MSNSFWKYLLYIMTNWIVFYACVFAYDVDTIRYSSNINLEGIFLAIAMLAVMPIIEILFFVPFNYIIRHRGVKLIVGISLLLTFEFGLNMFFTNGQPERWMYGKTIISFLVGLVFYYPRCRNSTSTRNPK